jgi:hypothetical protein
VSAQRIDQHGSLTDQKVAHFVQHKDRLLLGGLDGNKTHRRPGHRFCDRLRIGSIRLAALHVRLHIGWRHQSNRVPQLGELSRPIMRGGTGFHTDKTRRQSGEKPQDIASGATACATAHCPLHQRREAGRRSSQGPNRSWLTCSMDGSVRWDVVINDLILAQ